MNYGKRAILWNGEYEKTPAEMRRIRGGNEKTDSADEFNKAGLLAVSKDLWLNKTDWEGLRGDRRAFDSFIRSKEIASSSINFKLLDWTVIEENLLPRLPIAQTRLMGTLAIQDDKMIVRGEPIERVDMLVDLTPFTPGHIVYFVTPFSLFEQFGGFPTFFDLYDCYRLILREQITWGVTITNHGIFIFRPTDVFMKELLRSSNVKIIEKSIKERILKAAISFKKFEEHAVLYSQILQFYNDIGFELQHFPSPLYTQNVIPRKIQYKYIDGFIERITKSLEKN